MTCLEEEVVKSSPGQSGKGQVQCCVNASGINIIMKLQIANGTKTASTVTV